MNPRNGRILRYRVDWFPLVVVALLFVAQLTVWYFAPPWLAAIAAAGLLIVSLISAPIHHNHQHINTFWSPTLNRLLEIPLALQTGVGSYAWVLHHNLGHHLNYLEQHPGREVDESRWTRGDGSQMGRVEYTLRLFFRHPFDIHRVGRKHPGIYRRYLLFKLPRYAILAGMAWVNPVNTLIVFVVTPMLTLLHTSWVTYEHHAGLDTDVPMHASRNRINALYNFLSMNLGYHTAHHVSPGLHWSRLPILHARISDRIPDSHLNRAFW